MLFKKGGTARHRPFVTVGSRGTFFTSGEAQIGAVEAFGLFAPGGKSVKGMVQEFSTRTRSRSCRNVADTKLESPSERGFE